MRGLFVSISAMLFLASTALAQDPAATFPNKPIKIIVSVPAGGGVDTVTRIVAEGLHQKLGQPVIVENRAGAAGRRPGCRPAGRRPAKWRRRTEREER